MLRRAGCSKLMIVKMIKTILPLTIEKYALEVTKINRVSALLKNRRTLITERHLDYHTLVYPLIF